MIALGMGFKNSLAKVWEDRSAAREILIQEFFKKHPLRPVNTNRINFRKKDLANGDVVRYANIRLSLADFDGNGFVFPHILEKMSVGIYVRLPGEERAFIYNFNKKMMYCKKIAGIISQQNLLLIK